MPCDENVRCWETVSCVLCVCVHRAGFLEAGSPEQFTIHIVTTSFLLVVQHFCFIHPIGCVFVWYLILWCQKGKDTCMLYLLLSVWSGSRAVQSPRAALTPCFMRSLWAVLGQWGSPIASLSASGPKCLQSGQCQFGKMSALESERHRTDQSPGFWLLGSDVVYPCVLTDGTRTVAFCMKYPSVRVFGC